MMHSTSVSRVLNDSSSTARPYSRKRAVKIERTERVSRSYTPPTMWDAAGGFGFHFISRSAL